MEYLALFLKKERKSIFKVLLRKIFGKFTFSVLNYLRVIESTSANYSDLQIKAKFIKTTN